ncbi:hypothetical protein C8Q72DRAFT_169054 [Fomitopsis betulina]|nr:hypothetical protein C8Q72DRAFT_169054 [Fomitopsis betulina]
MLDPDQPIPIPFEDRPVAPKTPQHANQVFGFLSERRRSVRSRAESAFGLSTATLPQLDTASSSSRPSQPASEAGPPTPSFEESHWQTSVLHADIKTATLMKLSTAPAAICRQSTIASAPPSQTEFLGFPELQRARTGSSAHSALTHRSSIAQPSRIPRGPRARRSKQSLDRDFRRSQPDLPLDLQMQLHPDGVQDHATGSSAPGRRPSRPSGPRAEESSKSIDALATGPPRTYRRSTSRASIEAEAEERAPPVPPKPVSSRHQRGAHKRRSPRARPDEDKENSDISPQPSPALARSKSAALGGPSGGPVTPTRARSVFNTRHRPDLAHQPSPTSSSELSPLAKDMMANLRKQRLRVQHAARKSGRGMRAAS